MMEYHTGGKNKFETTLTIGKGKNAQQKDRRTAVEKTTEQIRSQLAAR